MGRLTRQKKLIEDFLYDISENAQGTDLIIFSGDLVNSGDNITIFNKAGADFLKPVLEKLDLKSCDFFICPGNHDVNRALVSNSVIKYLDEDIKSNDDLNNFFKKESPDLLNSYLPLKNYEDFTSKFFTDLASNTDFYCPLYTTHIRQINDKKIGIVCLNTSLRAIGNNDDNNLIFPTDKISEAVDRLMGCDIKILVHHHPLSDFKPFNKYELEDEIHKRFDFIFSGHIHKNALSIDFTFSEGVVKIGSSACLTSEKGAQVGYSIIDINTDDLIGEIDSRFYNTTYESFYSLEKKEFSIPSSLEKIRQNTLRKNIRDRLIEELDNSKSLFVEVDSKSDKSILDLSTDPVLNHKSQSEMAKGDYAPETDFAWTNFHLFENDYIIFGKDKCGKTILLKKIEIELLDNYSLHNYIPFYIDIKSWKNSNKIFDFKREFAKYYYINQSESLKLLEEKQIVFLIDNYHIDHESLKLYIENFISQHENVRLIICSIDSTLTTFDHNKIDGRSLTKLHFHRLRKIHIKELARKNSDLSDQKQEEIVDKIDNIFKKLSIPFNYWTISVFLWIFKKDLNANFQNDVDLINLYIERLLEKEQLTLTKSRFTFNNYKKLLAYVAHHLLTNFHENSYYAKYSDLIIFFDNYLSKNPRFQVHSKEIFEYLEQKEIFRKKDDDQYSFRLNGVFEYFVATYMTYDQEFLDDIIEDNTFYLSFANEFELYAGFEREDKKFLEKIYKKTQFNFKSVRNEYIEPINIDALLNSKILEAQEFSEIVEKFTRRLRDGLTEAEQDEIEQEMSKELGIGDETNSEVKCKSINELDNSSQSLEACLQILGKVFKNIDEIDDVKLIYEIFDYIIDNAILWGFKIVDDFKDMGVFGFTKIDGEAEAKFLSKVMTTYIPTLVQVRLYEMIGHNNLEKIICERLDQAKKDSKNNQYKLFILSFLLLDISIEHNKYVLEEIIPLVKIPLIKYSFIIKMNFYLAFKTNKNPELKRYLQKNIQSQFLKFNSETNLGGLHKGFSEQKNKQGLIKN